MVHRDDEGGARAHVRFSRSIPAEPVEKEICEFNVYQPASRLLLGTVWPGARARGVTIKSALRSNLEFKLFGEFPMPNKEINRYGIGVGEGSHVCKLGQFAEKKIADEVTSWLEQDFGRSYPVVVGA